MLEINFDQLVGIVGGLMTALTGAIIFLVKWIMAAINKLKDDLNNCEIKHDKSNEQIKQLAEKSSFLEGKLVEIETHNKQYEYIISMLEKILGKSNG